jgi:hypothetical protein
MDKTVRLPADASNPNITVSLPPATAACADCAGGRFVLQSTFGHMKSPANVTGCLSNKTARYDCFKSVIALPMNELFLSDCAFGFDMHSVRLARLPIN